MIIKLSRQTQCKITKELIAAVSDNAPKIIFREQQKHKDNDTAGIEIERDVRNLYKLYLFDDDYVDTLLKKVECKVKEKVLLYFFNQRKTIDLFEVLKYANVLKYDSKTFFEICKQVSMPILFKPFSCAALRYLTKNFPMHL